MYIIRKNKPSAKAEAALALAEALGLASPLPRAQLFTTIARAYYAEGQVIGRKPDLQLFTFGQGLGLDPVEVGNLANGAQLYSDAQRRAALGGKTARACFKTCDWIAERDGIYSRITL